MAVTFFAICSHAVFLMIVKRSIVPHNCWVGGISIRSLVMNTRNTDRKTNGPSEGNESTKYSDLEFDKITKMVSTTIQEFSKIYDQRYEYTIKDMNNFAQWRRNSKNKKMQVNIWVALTLSRNHITYPILSFNNVIHQIKIDILKFDGEDNREGTKSINKAEKYFDMHRIYDEDDKINIASMYLEKSTCDWFLW